MSESSKQQPTLASYLRTHRERVGMSIRQLAACVRIDHGYLAQLEAGTKSSPSAEILQRLAGALEVDSTELLAFIGVQPGLPEPTMYFRRKYRMSAEEAREAARMVEEYRARRKRNQGNARHQTNESPKGGES